MQERNSMANPISLIILPVKDVAQAKTLYNAFLGTEPYADSPYYVGYKTGNLEVGLVPNGPEALTYIDVEDIHASLKELQAAGGELHAEVKNVGGGLLVAAVKDADGNVLGLRQQPK